MDFVVSIVDKYCVCVVQDVIGGNEIMCWLQVIVEMFLFVIIQILINGKNCFDVDVDVYV